MVAEIERYIRFTVQCPKRLALDLGIFEMSAACIASESHGPPEYPQSVYYQHCHEVYE